MVLKQWLKRDQVPLWGVLPVAKMLYSSFFCVLPGGNKVRSWVQSAKYVYVPPKVFFHQTERDKVPSRVSFQGTKRDEMRTRVPFKWKTQ